MHGKKILKLSGPMGGKGGQGGGGGGKMFHARMSFGRQAQSCNSIFNHSGFIKQEQQV